MSLDRSSGDWQNRAPAPLAQAHRDALKVLTILRTLHLDIDSFEGGNLFSLESDAIHRALRPTTQKSPSKEEVAHAVSLRIFGLGKHLAELDGTVNAASESLAEVEEAMIAGADGLVECCGSTATSWHRWLIAFAGDTYGAITGCLGEVDQINEWATVIESPDVPAEKGWGRTESHPCELPGLPDAFKSPGEFAEWWLEEVECVQECVDACGWPDPIRLEAELEREFVRAWKHKDSGDQLEEKVFVPTRLQSTILKALDGQAMKKDLLAERCEVDPSRLYRASGINELRQLGKVDHKKGVGYFRPDAPPQG